MMKLSKQQEEIVKSPYNNIIVDAGSGSGKTRTLTERVRYVIESGADSSKVVVITFTNMAANELKSRLKNTPKAENCFIGTIHSYASKLLVSQGLDFEIFSEVYQTQFMEELMGKYAYYATLEDYKTFVKCQKQVSQGRMRNSDVPNHFTDYKVYKEILCLLGEHESASYPITVKTLCKQNNIITFDELLEIATQNKSSNSVDYLFVDELQDIGYLEYNFLMGLSAKNNFFIGDDYQAIFGFKGGDVDIFLSLMRNHDWKSYFLSENYRTAQTILLYANSIIKNCKNIINKDTVCVRNEPGSLQFVASKLFSETFKDVPDDEPWFIITRTNKELSYVCTELKNIGKPFSCIRRTDDGGFDKSSELNKNKINVMTAHSAKGLECKNVAVFGKFPIKGTGQEEELKVLYVAVTRAEDRCLIFI